MRRPWGWSSKPPNSSAMAVDFTCPGRLWGERHDGAGNSLRAVLTRCRGAGTVFCLLLLVLIGAMGCVSLDHTHGMLQVLLTQRVQTLTDMAQLRTPPGEFGGVRKRHRHRCEDRGGRRGAAPDAVAHAAAPAGAQIAGRPALQIRYPIFVRHRGLRAHGHARVAVPARYGASVPFARSDPPAAPLSGCNARRQIKRWGRAMSCDAWVTAPRCLHSLRHRPTCLSPSRGTRKTRPECRPSARRPWPPGARGTPVAQAVCSRLGSTDRSPVLAFPWAPSGTARCMKPGWESPLPPWLARPARWPSAAATSPPARSLSCWR